MGGSSCSIARLANPQRHGQLHPSVWRKGNLLLSTTKHGLLYFNAQKGTILPQSDKNFPFEVPDMQVNKMFTDSKGNLWLGSEDDGVKPSIDTRICLIACLPFNVPSANSPYSP